MLSRMKIWHVIVLIVCITVVVESHRNKKRKKKNKYWEKQQRRFRNSFSGSSSSSSSSKRSSYNYNWNRNVVTYQHVDSEVVVCGFDNSVVRETRECPLEYNCTAGPFQVKFGDEIGTYKFCNIPLKEEHVCKLIHKNSGNTIIDRTCPEGINCSAGPITHANFWSLYDELEMYFCGDSLPPLPTADVYERLLTAKACSVNGSITNMCNLRTMKLFWFNAHSSCSGITAELETYHGRDTLRFCKDGNDDDFSYIKLWGTPWCKGSRWDYMVNITRKAVTTEEPVTEPITTNTTESNTTETDSNSNNNPELPNSPTDPKNGVETPNNTNDETDNIGGETKNTNWETDNTNGETENTNGETDNDNSGSENTGNTGPNSEVDNNAGTDNVNGNGQGPNSVNIPSSSIDDVNQGAKIDP